MLSKNTIAIVKSTIPLLENAGVAITQHFYERMFRINPELKNIFNMSNQHSGRQQVALFSALASYAKHIETPNVLMAAIERITHKHSSLNIQPHHYDIVGHHLIETLRELAPTAFTHEVAVAWTEAYGFLASILIGREKKIYQDSATKEGGWNGARRFRVKDKVTESELVTSFILVPSDGGMICDYKSGQYLAISVKPENAEYTEIRQYSLSDKYNEKFYRISVKRELGEYRGVVSNFLHDSIHVGDELDVMPPAGDFFLQSTAVPNVLISAGVGLTPMMSMLEAIVDVKDHAPVFFLHACEKPEQLSFAHRIQQLEQEETVNSFVWYGAVDGLVANNTYSGLMEIAKVADQLPISSGHFYLCGPVGFMRFAKNQLLTLGVENERIHYEVFGPHNDF